MIAVAPEKSVAAFWCLGFGRSPLGKGSCAGWFHFLGKSLADDNPNPSEDTMTLILYAQPYNIDAEGFYFRTADEYAKTLPTIKDSFGQPVEEFEIEFIDGDDINCGLAKAWGLNQANFAAYFYAADTWHDHEKTAFIIAVGECGYDFDPASVSPNDFEVDLYHLDSLKDLAVQFVEDGLLGDIPERLRFYFDYDALARDLGVDYSETRIAGENIIYRCG